MSIKTNLIGLICLLSLTASAQNYVDSLQNALAKIQTEGIFPGYAVAIVDQSGVIYKNAEGFSDLESKKAYTTETVQRLGSVSKTVIALALTKLVEEGKLTFNTPINSILPTPIYNPKFPKKEILIEHLMTHTSGIIDVEKPYWYYSAYFLDKKKPKNVKYPRDYRKVFRKWRKNNPVELGTYCYNFLLPSGKYYSKKGFADYPPGSYTQYSNIGASLAAHIVELITGESFQDYSDAILFTPLQLKNTGWTPEVIPAAYLATPYETPKLLRVNQYVDVGFPEGGWHCSVEALGLYLSEMIRGSKGDGKLLSPDGYATMFAPRLDTTQASTIDSRSQINTGVFWALGKNGEIRHDGGFVGASVFMRFNAETGIGKIFMTNLLIESNPAAIKSFIKIWKTLSKYETQINSINQ